MTTPRRWWPGPLDVERLACESVDAVRAGVEAVARARGQRWQVETSPELVAASFAAIDHLRVDGRRPEGFAPMSGFFPAADGWVRLHANYPHHEAALTRALGVADRQELQEAIVATPAATVEARVAAEGGIAVVVRTPQEWAAHPHGAATAGDPWATVEERSDRRPLTGGDLPLDGVRVLDLTRVIAGPTCSQDLACLGANVLRADPPHRPELLDQHLSNGMGKRSAVVDLRAGSVEHLLPVADVVLLGYRPGSLARFGLDPDELVARHPHLVVVSLSAWGEHGPWAQRPGFDSIVQATCGIATTYARPDGAPGALPVQALDHSTGHRMAAHAIDLLGRGRSGVVRISLLGAARTLFALGTPPVAEPADLEVPLLDLESPHGRLTCVPPPLTLDGASLERPVGGYGAATPAWAG